MRPGQAKGQLKQLLNGLDGDALDPTASLFVPVLRERMSWVREECYYLRQKTQALRLLDARDYRGAAVTAFEAFISKLVQEQGGNISNFDEWDRAKYNFEESRAMGNESIYAKYRKLAIYESL